MEHQQITKKAFVPWNWSMWLIFKFENTTSQLREGVLKGSSDYEEIQRIIQLVGLLCHCRFPIVQCTILKQRCIEKSTTPKENILLQFLPTNRVKIVPNFMKF